MSYEKQNFTNGTLLTADHLNHMEEGIANAGPVKTVNGAQPDENGNVEILIETGATSWNDLEDKPFGKEEGEAIFTSEVAFSEPNADGCCYVKSDAVTILPNQNSQYTVTITTQDGATISKTITAMNSGDYMGSYEMGKYEYDADNGYYMIVVFHWSFDQCYGFYNYGPAGIFDIKISYPPTAIPISDEYIPTTIPCVSTATVGQIIMVKAVDDNGKPTEWMTVDIPKAVAVADVSGESPTSTEFNALLAALRNAGFMDTE